MIFAVCAGYQLIGSEFGGAEGEPVAGLGILDIRSGRGERRGVGEIVADVDPQLGVPTADRLREPPGRDPGSARRPAAGPGAVGVGNGDGTEGAYAGRVLGTYLHGPALVRNPALADLLLTWAAGPLPPLDPAADEEWARRLREERLAAVPGCLDTGRLVHRRLVHRRLVDQGLRAVREISATNVAAPAIRTPSISRPRAMSRRAAHWVHSVTRPPARIPSSRSPSGGGVRQAEVTGPAGQREPGRLAGEPQRHRTPLATAAAATVKRLVAPLRVVLARGDLDDRGWSGHGAP